MSIDEKLVKIAQDAYDQVHAMDEALEAYEAAKSSEQPFNHTDFDAWALKEGYDPNTAGYERWCCAFDGWRAAMAVKQESSEQPVELPPCPKCGELCTKLIGKHIFDTHTKEETSYYCFACNMPINATKRESGEDV